jgi:beta-glucosidase-like glycosyl hydrolase
MRMMMGLFDPTIENKYQKIPLSVVGHADSQMMSLNAARKGMVLLKQGPLPFAKGKVVAVIGQAVSSTADMTGNYDGGCHPITPDLSLPDPSIESRGQPKLTL